MIYEKIISENQKSVNGAVDDIIEFLKDGRSYSDMLGNMLAAQTSVMQAMMSHEDNDEFRTAVAALNQFIEDAYLIMVMLHPIANMIGQIKGKED